MSFDVFLLPSSASPPAGAYDQRVVAAALSVGAWNVSVDGGRTGDGLRYETYGGGSGTMFALRGMSPGICAVIFAAAKSTNSYIYATGGLDYAAKPKGIRGTVSRMGMPIKTLSTPKALCAMLEQGYGGWGNFRDRVRAQVNPPGQ